MAAIIEMRPRDESMTVASAQKHYLSGDYAQAGAIAEMYLREHPDDAQALSILSAVYKQADRTSLAYILGRRASELRPDRPETWVCHGFAAQALWRTDEALSCYRKALQRAASKQQKALYNNNIASVYLDLGKFDVAERYVDESLKLEPEEMNARHNKGLCLLAKRDWGAAWGYYSASIGSNQRTEFRYNGPVNPEPRWDGKPFAGNLVVFGEQGLGDEICAASAIPEIHAAQESVGGRLIIDCDKRLEGLYRRSFHGVTVHGTRTDKVLNWPTVDRDIGASIACFEVLKHFRGKPEDFPNKPYLTPCPDRTAMWKHLFGGKLTIGIAWSGGTWKNAGSYRRLALEQWRPIFEAVDANWVSLQYRDASEEIEGTPVKQYPWATLTKDYDDTAALVAACDLVISVPTAVVHLAGALGTPCISMKASTPCWKYYGDSLAFTPDVKLIDNDGDWTKTVIAAAKEVKARYGRA
jgi:tetratricopeptide (TPR) repeat protein